MKKALTSLLIGLTLIVSSVLASDGKSIFQSKGCAACHQPQIDTIGPSIKTIAEAYNGKKEDLIKFLKGEAGAKVWPDKFPIMQPQLNTTKTLPEKDLEALADYILDNN